MKVDVVAAEAQRGFRFETWRFTGSQGDEVLADAYLTEEPAPVVVIGHGKGNNRKAQYIRGPGALWARAGLNVVAFDAPLHGDRPGSIPEITAADPGFAQWWQQDAALAVGAARWRLGEGPVGYLGFSMGGVFGVGLMASEDDLRAGVLVVAGSAAVSVAERFPDRSDLAPLLDETDPCAVAGDIAPRPVLMLNADDDEIFSRRSALALYDAFGSPKEITFLPGTHSVWRSPARWFRLMFDFLWEPLTAGS
jgi:alpha-beta hydrolase superfamily lysophospholipase